MKRKRYSTIFYQLALFFFVAGILPIAILGMYMYSRINSLAGQELTHSYELLASQYLGTVQEKVRQYETSLGFISKNTVINEQLRNRELNSYIRGRMISEEVSQSLLLDDRNTIRNCLIYSYLEDRPVYGSRITMREAAAREKWFHSWNGVVEEWFFYENPVHNGENLGVLVYPIYYLDQTTMKQEQIGIVRLEFYLQRLLAPAGEDKNTFRVAVFDDDGQVWYQNGKDDGAEALECLKTVRENEWNDGIVRNVNGQLVCSQRLNECGLDILLFFGRDGLEQKRREVNRMILPLILLVTVVDSAECYVFAGMFSKRVRFLVNKFKRVETGDFSVTESVSGKDELRILDDQFNHMLETINSLIRESYVQELEKKETELQNLQLQINPHFLYNTLETISSIAAVRQTFAVCELCGRLGEIFRYSLGKDYGEFVTVEQEMQHVENYVYIQKVRYGDKFEVFYHVEPQVRQCLILRFILQPLVENAILHGIAPMTGSGTLEITVERREETLLVRVEDDGVGMDSMKKTELEEYINIAKGCANGSSREQGQGSIGVRNVHQRVQLACGEQYGVTIESEPYRGTSFLITFPLCRREDKTCTD